MCLIKILAALDALWILAIFFFYRVKRTLLIHLNATDIGLRLKLTFITLFPSKGGYLLLSYYTLYWHQ